MIVPLLALLLSVAAASTVARQDVCQYLQSTLPKVTVLRSDGRFAGLSTENWYVRKVPRSRTSADHGFRSATAWGKPMCVVQPSTTADVQKIVSYLSSRRIRFAIRSGGHLPSPLGANTNDGVLIDTSSLNVREYDQKTQTVKIGTGNKWKNVYDYLDQYRVTVVGGRVLDVGVGGLVLGSGLSYLSDLYGMACDNVNNFEVRPCVFCDETTSHSLRSSLQMAPSSTRMLRPTAICSRP